MPAIGPATQQLEARSIWTSAYPLEPFSGGSGCFIVCSGTSANVQIPGSSPVVPTPSPNSVYIQNVGTNWAFVQFGSSSSVSATAPAASGTGSCSTGIPPGASVVLSLLGEGQLIFTWVAAVCQSGQTTTLQITLAMGGN